MNLTNKHQQHYCRHCTEDFPAVSKRYHSAHDAYSNHLRRVHPEQHRANPARFICTKHCLGKEQSDEHQHGVKLYGPGAARLTDLVPLIMTAEQIYGEED